MVTIFSRTSIFPVVINGSKRGESIMASKNYYKCVQCQQETPSGHLFDALHDLSKGVVSNCAACGGTNQLHKMFEFALKPAAQNASCCMCSCLQNSIRGRRKIMGTGSLSIPSSLSWNTRARKAEFSGCLIGTLKRGRGRKRKSMGNSRRFWRNLY